LYTFIEAYFTPAGGSEIFLGGKNVNIDAGLKDGVTVDMGAMGLLPGNFSVRTHNDGIAPSIINATNISYDLDVSSNLSTSTTSPVEQLTATISVNAAGQLLVTTHLPNTHTQPIYAFIVPYITQNGNTVYIDGQNVVIPANAKDSPAVNFGTLNVNTGAYSVRLSNLGTNPTSTDGVVINFSASTNFSLVK
ncbi:MAG: hypothetical protein JWQ57_3545, partial [Mucilaginibacter sp.]|nr:hypothetical protein [Mucilaginibacter sp.]